MFGLGRKGGDERAAFEPWDVLVGLAPSLVEDLAELVGSTEDDLLVSFQVMPFGDRATLAAYGVIDLDRGPSGRRQVTKVHTIAVDLVNMASEYLLSQEAEIPSIPAQDDDINPSSSRIRLLASAAVPRVHVVNEMKLADGPLVRGVVVAVDEDRVLVRVPVLSSVCSVGHRRDLDELPTGSIEISPDHGIGGPGTTLTLIYESSNAPLDQPQSIMVEDLIDT